MSSLNSRLSEKNSEKSTLNHYQQNSECAKIYRHETTTSRQSQESHISGDSFREPFNSLMIAPTLNSTSFVLRDLTNQLKEVSSNSQSFSNLKPKGYNDSSESFRKESKYEEKKLSKGFTDIIWEDENIRNFEDGKNNLDDDRGSLKLDLNNSLGSAISIPERDEDEQIEEVKEFQETQEILEESTRKIDQLFQELDEKLNKMTSFVVEGEILEAYNMLMKLKQENPTYFKEADFRSSFHETLVLTESFLFWEALPKLESMLKIPKKYMKVGPDLDQVDLNGKDRGALYHKIGRCNSELGDFDKSQEYFEESKRILEKYSENHSDESPYLLVKCLRSLTDHHIKYRNSDLAVKCAKKALELALTFKSKERGMSSQNLTLSCCYLNYCNALISKGRLEEAEENLDCAQKNLAEYLKDRNYPESKPYFLNAKIKRCQAQLAFHRRLYHESIDLYDKALLILDKTLPAESKLIKDYKKEMAVLKILRIIISHMSRAPLINSQENLRENINELTK